LKSGWNKRYLSGNERIDISDYSILQHLSEAALRSTQRLRVPEGYNCIVEEVFIVTEWVIGSVILVSE
jgi:hypothetical protein